MSELPKDKKIVILDFDIPELFGNKIFNPVFSKKASHTILPTCYLYQEAQKQGIQFVTPDIFLDLKEKPKNTLLMTHLKSPQTEKLISLGAKPTILTCQESPFIATGFYIKLKKYSSLYKHSFVFKGMKKKLSKKTIYHQMFFPQAYSYDDFKPADFNKKRFLTMIASFKNLVGWKKIIKTSSLKLMYSWNIKEIYFERIKAIKFFSKKDNFDLFGFNWSKANFSQNFSATVKECYRGTVEDKLEALKDYKFALCFENTVMEGYITEKIFDALFAGTVPIYFGAPDIEEYVDKDCFIDFRKFKNFNELYHFLLTINENEYNQYIQNIKKHLQSDLFSKFTQENFAKEILDILNQEFVKI